MNSLESTLESMQRNIEVLLRQQADDLWAAEEIALYLKLSKKSVQNHITSHDTFPEPVELITGGKRWVAKEVRAWVMKRR